MANNQYFRAGTGTVIYNEKGEILLFSRSDKPDVWQLQQGGMNTREIIAETLWRELREETGLYESDLSGITAYPEWLFYKYPDSLRVYLPDQDCHGQIHRWFFLKLKPNIKIDLTSVYDKEFRDFKWSTFAELLSQKDLLKLDVYTKLSIYFSEKILPSLEIKP